VAPRRDFGRAKTSRFSVSYRTKEIAPPETSADESTVAHDEDESLSDPLPPITAISENDEILDNQTNGDMSMMFVMMGLIFMVGSLSSLDRVAMSVALVPMAEEMGLSDSVKGGISSFFSIGYGLGILPAGLMLSQLSPRYIMAAGICLWSLGTIATPFSAAQTSMSLLLFARILVGASESVVVPTIQRFLSAWIPPDKKSLAVAVVFCSFQTGTILAYSLSPLVIDHFDDWRSVFYVYGSAGLLFLVPWLTLSQDSPNKSMKANNKDASTFLKWQSSANDIGSAVKTAKSVLLSAPWQGFARSKATWAMFLAHAANNWGLYNNLSWTPTFYAEQYGLNVKESALLLVVPSIAGAVGGLSAGLTADSIIQNMEDCTDQAITRVRKTFQGLALFGPSICLATLAANIPEEPWIAQSLFAGAVAMQSLNAAGYGAANQEKAGPKWTGLLYSVTSLPSVVVGTVGVQVTGIILDATGQNWSYVFAINAGIYVVGASAFVILYNSQQEFD
jgi:ACS family sodium-dependent inorganic phosphate cotransporter